MDPRYWEADSEGLEGCEDVKGTRHKGQTLGLMSHHLGELCGFSSC